MGRFANQVLLPLCVLGVLVCVRGATSFRQAWFEGDDISIAAGVGALLNDNCGDDYRYEVQPGYYRLVQGAVLVLGGSVGDIPEVMFALSALAGAWICVLALFAFPKTFTQTQRWVLLGILFANPILWVSSQYGNSALPSSALGATCVVLLTREVGRRLEILALLCWASAALIRADAVLLAPVVGFLLWRRHGLLGMVLRGALVGVVVGGVYGALIALDPRMGDPFDAVGAHVLGEEVRSHFWSYLLWAMAPLPLAFAAAGMFSLLVRRDGTLVALLLWVLPVAGFYFTSTTTPRYFLLATFPMGALASVAVIAAHRAARGVGPRVAAMALVGLLGAHLLVAFGHRDETKGWKSWFADATVATDDGPMPTGWLLLHGYRNLRQRLAEPAFLGANGFAREVEQELAGLLEGGGPGRIFFVLGGFPTVSFHYHAQRMGGVYLSRAEAPAFGGETRITFGDTTVITSAYRWGDFERFEQLPLEAGDRLWVSRDVPNRKVMERLPEGLGVRPEPDLASPLVRRYTLVRK